MSNLATVETTALGPGFNLAAVNLATRALAPNSRAAYRQALERLAASTGGQPVTDGSLAAHVQDLHNQGMAPASISIVPAAVRYYARAHGAADPVGPMTKAAMRIVRREGRGRGRGQAGGIKWEQADAAAAVAGNGGQDPAGLRDAAILAIMSDCLLRVSEVADLDVSDLDASYPDGSGTVTLRASKTDQEGEGVTLYVGPATVQRVQAWTGKAGLTDGPLFRRIRRGGHVQADRITARAVQGIVKARAQAAGIVGNVSGHSLRVGAAQSLAQAGAGVVEMQTAGRWASPDMPGRYARREMAARGAVARLRYGQ